MEGDVAAAARDRWPLRGAGSAADAADADDAPLLALRNTAKKVEPFATLAPTSAAAPTAAAIGRVHKQLSKRNASLYSCLCSIVDDAAFVREVARLYPALPLVANLRAGLWYAEGAWHPQQQPSPQSPPPTGLTAYFKSTDGHHGEWAFSTTRLNWPLALLLAERGGALLVDATRRGKRFPDALAKTAPIWCAVLNRAVARVRARGGGSGGAAAFGGAAGAARRAGSLPRHPSLGDWAAAAGAAAAGGQQPAAAAAPTLRAVPSLNEWLDDEAGMEEDEEGEEGRQQQHALLPTLPQAAPLVLPSSSPFAAAAAGLGQGQQLPPLPPARPAPPSSQQRQATTGVDDANADPNADANARLLRPTPPPPATPAPPTKRRLPWWHADAAPLDDEEEEQEDDDGSDGATTDDDEGGDDTRRPPDLAPAEADADAVANPPTSPPSSPSPSGWDTSLHLPPWIGRSEAAQIEARLEGWVDALLSAAGRPAVESLSSRLLDPLRPLWLCQGSRIFTDAVAQPADLPFTPLVLVSASDTRAGRRPLGSAHAALLRGRRGRRDAEEGTEEGDDQGDDDDDDDTKNDTPSSPAIAATYEYLPGAGDDEESWARGLTPAVFWAHAGEVLSAGEAGAEAAARGALARLAGERHHASERDARRAAAGAPGYAVAGSGGGGAVAAAGGAANAAANADANAASEAGEAPWPLGDDVPLLLGGLASARLPEGARAAAGAKDDAPALLLVGPSVHASLVPELERTRAQAEAWLAAVGGASSFFDGGDGDAVASPPAPSPPPPDILWLPVGGPKADRCSLTLALGPALRFVAAHLSGSGKRVLVADADGASTCVCVAAAALQAMFEAEREEGEEARERDEEEGLIGRRVRMRPGAAEALASGAALAAASPSPSSPPPTRESVRRWVAFAAARYPPARPHRLAVKSVWAFFVSGSGGRRGLPPSSLAAAAPLPSREY